MPNCAIKLCGNDSRRNNYKKDGITFHRMYHSESIKVEYGSKWPAALCHACLSAERALSPLGTLADVYRKICNIGDLSMLSDVCLCWECTAVLKRMRLFKDRVAQAQSLLGYYNSSYETSNQILPKCLSTLTATSIDIESSIFITDSDKTDIELHTTDLELNTTDLELKTTDLELKTTARVLQTVEIKKELDQDIFDYFDHSFEEIKEETPSLCLNSGLIKTETTDKQKRKRAYRMVVHPSQLVSENVTQVKIQPKDLPTWIENERASAYYMNLKNKCDKCLRRLKRHDSMEKHNKLYHCKSIGPYECDICGTHFSTKHALAKHLPHHYVGYTCRVCPYQCYIPKHMYRHINSHKKTVQCLECDACYGNVRRFYAHYKALHTQFVCDHCNKKCNSKRTLERHMKQHDPPECKLCNQRFKNIKSLAAHNAMKHASGGESAFCVRCDRQFHSTALYRRHVHTSAAHADERHKPLYRIKKEKVPCPACGNVYSRKTYMMNHYRHVHMNKSKFYCTDCDKPFLNRTRYVDHRKFNHEGYVKEKNKLCNICGRGFAANRTLENHMRTHSGERPFVCTYCDSKFTQKQAMLSHVKFIHLKCRRKNTDYII